MKHLLLATMTLGLAFSAQAVEHEEIAAEFSYSRQQLETDAGASRVLAELTETVRQACKIEYGDRQMVPGRIDHKCFDQMMADAIATIDAPNLTALHVAQTR